MTRAYTGLEYNPYAGQAIFWVDTTTDTGMISKAYITGEFDD